MLERQNVTLQGRLLRLGPERDVERSPRVRQGRHENPDLRQRPGDRGVEPPKSTSASNGPWFTGLRVAHLNVDQVELDPAPGHVQGHRHFGTGTPSPRTGQRRARPPVAATPAVRYAAALRSAVATDRLEESHSWTH